MFIGSSKEALDVARAIQLNLDHSAACTIWDQGVFGLGATNVEALIAATKRHDFAVLVATAEDYSFRRGRRGFAPRDNILWELGLFTGELGMRRTFVVFDRDNRPMLPSDLDGLCCATYSMNGHSTLRSAVGAACTEIADGIKREHSKRGRRRTP